MVRTVFMGTPEFAVPALLRLATMPVIELVTVITRRDQPAGRGNTLTPPPVKIAAQAHQVPVWQPGSLKRAETQAQLAELAPELIVVAAFGQILPPTVLDLPRHGCLNIHASLLPRYRGAAPITAAILQGDAETGNTIMRMDVGLDTGAMITQARLPILPDDTTATLTTRLAVAGADLLAETLPAWLAGTLSPQPQDEQAATLTRLIRKDDGLIDWTQPAAVIARQVRAYVPWPGSSTRWQAQPLKIHVAHVFTADTNPAAPGTTIAIGSGKTAGLGVVCGDQAVLALDVIQLPGKRALPAAEVVRGQPRLVGARLPS